MYDSIFYRNTLGKAQKKLVVDKMKSLIDNR